MHQLITTLQHRAVRSQLSVLGGYDTTHTGEMITVFPDRLSHAPKQASS